MNGPLKKKRAQDFNRNFIKGDLQMANRQMKRCSQKQTLLLMTIKKPCSHTEKQLDSLIKVTHACQQLYQCYL